MPKYYLTSSPYRLRWVRRENILLALGLPFLRRRAARALRFVSAPWSGNCEHWEGCIGRETQRQMFCGVSADVRFDVSKGFQCSSTRHDPFDSPRATNQGGPTFAAIL